MRHQLCLWAVLPLVVWQAVRAQTFKCDDADGKGRGYTIDGSVKHECQEGTFCYQLGKGLYCGVGSSDPLVSESNSVAATEAMKAVSGSCAKDGTATCKLDDGQGAAFIRCINGESQEFKCGGGSVCYQDGEGILCGVKSSAKACTPGAVKCSAEDGASADFTRCIGGEQVALTCGQGLTCYQEGSFHVRCATGAEGNNRAVYPVYPITSAGSSLATCAANTTTAAPSSSTKGYGAPPVTGPTVDPSVTFTTAYSTVSDTTTTTTTVTSKPAIYTLTKNENNKANGPTLIRSNVFLRPSGKNMVEIDVNYNPAEVAQLQRCGGLSAASQGSFDQPDAFSREITNYALSQGYSASPTGYASSSNMPYSAPYPSADLNTAYPSPNSYAAPPPPPAYKPAYSAQPSYSSAYSAQPSYNSAYSAQPSYNSAYSVPSSYDNARQPLALNAGFATVIPDNIQVPQLIYSLQNAMQLSNQQPAAAYQPLGPQPMPQGPQPMPLSPVYITVSPPITSCPTITCPPVTVCPTTTQSCSKTPTHTVFISVETNCVKAEPKPTCCQSEPECSSKHKHKHKHKHTHTHSHKTKKKDDSDDECETTTECKTSEHKTTDCTTSSESCEPTSSKKHSHSHSHQHKHKHKSKDNDSDDDSDCDGDSPKKKGDCNCEDCGDCCGCFGRAVVSISSGDEKEVTTLGKKMFAFISNQDTVNMESESVDHALSAVVRNAITSCESPQPTTHTAFESVETGCKCQCGGECKCGDKCTCKSENSHTVIVSVDSSNEKPTSCAPTSAQNTHTVIQSVECSLISPSPRNTHTVIESVECSLVVPSPVNTHTVIESVECSLVVPSPVNTHTIIESIECICSRPSAAAPKHTHTVYESVECRCGPSCGKNTHVVFESVECGCASSSDSCQPTSSCQPTTMAITCMLTTNISNARHNTQGKIKHLNYHVDKIELGNIDMLKGFITQFLTKDVYLSLQE
ncbi:hypothetical protein IWW37_003555 [Coemansia sp. RSA 2050]|nr:hypothetical protein IWW37_003555 [Coemansia sp. RSA 2050]